MFQTYGTKIRVGPKTVLFNTPSAYRDIYSHKANVRKDNFYSIWKRHDGDVTIFNETNVKMHATRRKTFNTAFTDKSVRSAGFFIIKNADRWNELLITDDDWSAPTNLTEQIDHLIFDILGDLCFGQSFGTIEPGESAFQMIPSAIASYMKFWNPIAKSPLLDTVLWLKPRGLNRVLEWLIPQEIQRYYAFLDQKVTERMEQEADQQKFGQDKGNKREDMLHYLLKAKDPETGQPSYSKEGLLAEANVLVIAGSHTTSTALAGFFFYITHYPRVYAKVTDYIRGTFALVDEIVDGPKLSSCHYLRACLDEALRLGRPGPAEIPRVVLPGGQTIDGEYVPEGVTVGLSAWSSGLSTEIYGDDSYIFRPERWIVDEKNGVTAGSVAYIKGCFHPFSDGPGNCVGQSLAVLEMMLITARTLYRMDVRIAPGSTLGEGAPDLGWGRRDKNIFQFDDAYIALTRGPMIILRRSPSSTISITITPGKLRPEQEQAKLKLFSRSINDFSQLPDIIEEATGELQTGEFASNRGPGTSGSGTLDEIRRCEEVFVKTIWNNSLTAW
ncbi:MAG: hypothetical protein LQ342_003646 [Letrouitia transgressa]|nr:MAG: hypothetical protein LQ342_003646 [Letrouitia transgressa]